MIAGLHGQDFTFTVTGSEDVTERLRRVRFTDGGMLALTGVHPTVWVRMWFAPDGKSRQRAYTLIDATLQGTGFAVPDPLPGRLFVIGDPASFPAVNSLLDALPGVRCSYVWTRRTTSCAPLPAVTPAPTWSSR